MTLVRMTCHRQDQAEPPGRAAEQLAWADRLRVRAVPHPDRAVLRADQQARGERPAAWGQGAMRRGQAG